MRIPLHGANDGLVVTPENAGYIGPDPLCYGDKGYFLPCDCFDICTYIEENGGTAVGLKFEIAIVPTKAKLDSLFWESLSTCAGVELKLTYEDITGAPIEDLSLTAANSVLFTDDWTTVDTSHMYHMDKAGEAGYIGRGDAGIIALEVIADTNNALLGSCCEGDGCDQPLLQWAIKYDSSIHMRNVFDVCNDGKFPIGRSLEAVDCAPTQALADYDASTRKTELAFALSMQKAQNPQGIPFSV